MSWELLFVLPYSLSITWSSSGATGGSRALVRVVGSDSLQRGQGSSAPFRPLLDHRRQQPECAGCAYGRVARGSLDETQLTPIPCSACAKDRSLFLELETVCNSLPEIDRQQPHANRSVRNLP
jgi:hypothetical protein